MRFTRRQLRPSPPARGSADRCACSARWPTPRQEGYRQPEILAWRGRDCGVLAVLGDRRAIAGVVRRSFPLGFAGPGADGGHSGEIMAIAQDPSYWYSCVSKHGARVRGLLCGDGDRHSARAGDGGEPRHSTASLFRFSRFFARSRRSHGCRPSIIFWPTQELSIAFVTFLGAFFTIVINVIGGAQAIDMRYYQAARSMGSSSWDIFRRIILPGTLPSIIVGATVGMGITWAVVVAAEMISGGGSAGSMGGAGRRPRLLHLEFLRRRLLHADRGRA